MDNTDRKQIKAALVKKMMEDNNYKSRKLNYGIMTSLSIVGLGIFSAWKLPALAVSLDVIIGGLIAVYAIYCGANVGNKVNVGKTAGKYLMTAEAASEEAPVKPPPQSQNVGD